MDQRADRLTGLRAEVFDTYDDANAAARDFVEEFGGRLYIYGDEGEGFAVDDDDRHRTALFFVEAHGVVRP